MFSPQILLGRIVIRDDKVMNFAVLFTAGWVLLPCLFEGVVPLDGDSVSSRHEITIIESHKDGPTVLVIAGIHGNEPAGVEAAKRIGGWQILKGRVVVLAEANQAAIAAQKRLIPGAPVGEGDLNRNFPVDEHGCHPVGDVATELWQVIKEHSPQWLVDLHESINFRRVDPQSVGNTIIVCPNEQTLAMGQKLVDAINKTITDESKKFLLLRPPAKGSLTRAAAETMNVNAILIETTRREPLETRVKQHCLLLERFFRELGMLEPEEEQQ